ncbi:MAG: ParB/RepB/Spo0J family partition protein, partial [Armatimonadota bacterium]|nr:ParB/RepB/Spo0J family partition protein [Armatimonadota bacterium]
MRVKTLAASRQIPSLDPVNIPPALREPGSKTIAEYEAEEAAGKENYLSANNQPSNGKSKPPGDQLKYIPLALIFPNPAQPRTNFDEAKLDELAESVRQVGVLQPITVRKMPDQPMAYQIIAGERRYRAAQKADLNVMPCLVKVEMDDGDTLLAAVKENIDREDLTPIELAVAYEKLSHFFSQAEIGRQVGRSQPVIANHIRLLRLPEDVQQRIERAELSVSHGLALVRFADFPEVASKIAEWAVQKNVRASELEHGLPWSSALINPSDHNGLDLKEPLACQIGWSVPFRETCTTACPFNACIQVPDTSTHFCLKPAHYAELMTQAEEVNRKEAEESLARARAVADPKLQAKLDQVVPPGYGIEPTPVFNQVVMFPDSPGPAELKPLIDQEDLSPAILPEGYTAPIDEGCAAHPPDNAEPAPFLRVAALPCGSYIEITNYNQPPPGCDEGCPCYVKGLDDSGNLVDLCLQPGRWSSLKSAETRERKKTLRAKFQDQLSELGAWFSDTPSPHALAIWAQITLETMPVNTIRAVTDKQPPEFRKVVEDRSGMRKNEDAWTALSQLPPATMINMVVECRIRERMSQALDGGGSGNPMIDWLLQQPRAG